MVSSATPHHHNLLTEPVGPVLTRMAIPMVIGIVSTLMFNITDTLWVAQLGHHELAALTFTFPVSYIVMSLTMGIGVGVSAAISYAIGEGNHEKVKQLTTHGLLLAIAIVLIVSTIGMNTIHPMFSMMGASDETRLLIHDYMYIWYAGCGLLIVPMLINAAIRSTGDTRTPSIIMMTSAGMNAVLDPLFIFGIGPFPRMEIKGAAVASVIAWGCSLLAALWVAHRRGMLEACSCSISEIRYSWNRILYIGLPAAGSNILAPMSAAVLTALVAPYGSESVAGYGVGTRIDSLALVVIMALASVLTPFIGQNWGAHQFDRVHESIRSSIRFCLIWESSLVIILMIASPYIATAFTDNPEVSETIVSYLWILPLGYGFQGVTIITSSAFNAIRRPMHAMGLTILRLFVLTLPIAFIGGYLFGPVGIFGGAAFSNILAGLLSIIVFRRSIARAEVNMIVRKE